MKKKEILTIDEKNWMDTIAVNYIIAQSDGYQLGYAQAINDFTEKIIDNWNASDDKPQQSILDTLVDLGVELSKRKNVAKKNIEQAKEHGYENYYDWKFKMKSENLGQVINIFTKDFPDEDKTEK